MTAKENYSTASATGEADEIRPNLDAAWFAEADAFVGTRLVRRGRPKSERVKQPVSLRLDPDVVDWFKRGGDGWQTRINTELRKLAGI